jgi:hypothetical protein
MSLRVFAREVETFPIRKPFQFKTEQIDSKRVIIYFYNENKNYVAYQVCYVDPPEMWLESGRTEENYRRRGYGTWIRAVAAWCAKRAGFKKIHQTSSFLTNTPKTNRPTSAYIMNKLGFKHENSQNGSSSEFRYLNLNQNIPEVNAIIRKLKSTN